MLLNNFHKIKYCNNQAFTLIELIVVISMISILLAFSLPRLDISFFSDNDRKISSWILLNVKSLKENAVKEQSLQILNIDIDNNQMWSSSGPVTEETPKENEYQIPSGYRLMDVEFLNADKVTKGICEIHFYKKGYSDKALIHIEDNDNNQYSYLIEPFLPHVKIIEKYIEF
ncbi:MAG: type II secretion system protein [Desulfobacteraceae bacterium]|nr:type II secretion system protein [Desulfobacteraceae bacterium]MBC2755761.1 type II secretion system protein [Desulfobacteraceae bacterium]